MAGTDFQEPPMDADERRSKTRKNRQDLQDGQDKQDYRTFAKWVIAEWHLLKLFWMTMLLYLSARSGARFGE